MAEQKAFLMDCMEAMRQMPDAAFELAIVDPPYGIGAGKEKPHNLPYTNGSYANTQSKVTESSTRISVAARHV